MITLLFTPEESDSQSAAEDEVGGFLQTSHDEY